MPYVPGTANSFADLLAALRNACTANGWTLSGNVLSKDGCFAEAIITKLDAGSAPANGAIQIKVGNGKDGSNLLTDPCNGKAFIGRLVSTGSTYPDWDWPVNYRIHINSAPDEVVMVVNYGAGQYFQWLMFGKSPAPGNAGTGNWCDASISAGGSLMATNTAGVDPTGVTLRADFSYPRWTPIPFWRNNSGGGATPHSHQFHGVIDATSGAARWNDNAVPSEAQAPAALQPLIKYSPNAWDSETHLFPLDIVQFRSSAKTSIIGSIASVRLCRNDYIDPEGLIDLTPDHWKVYPCFRKNDTARDGAGTGTQTDHSGTFAIAVKYDGPLP
jgi:hypothetical protein